MNDAASGMPRGIITAIVNKFLTSHLSVILIILAVCMGAAAVLVTPREEEPQIVVPLADVYVQFPGASADEVEKLVATPLEKLLWQIDGVEYVYSMSRRDMAIITVRFYVGEDRVKSLVKLHNKISMNIDRAPPGIRGWVIKPVEIDDVPILNITLYSDIYDDHQLRRIGEEVITRLDEVKDISRTCIVGGRRQEVRVELDPEKMIGLKVSPLEVERALRGADASITAGTFALMNKEITVSSDSFILTSEEIEKLMVSVHNNCPVYLRDIATVIDGPEEASNYSRIGFPNRTTFPAVTLALAKKKGTNAVAVAGNILQKLENLKKSVIPSGVHTEITRNYGKTADRKVKDLLSSLFFAIITVVVLVAFTMGWREGIVVALAVPVSFSLALFVNYLFGYTINRVTLFALILSLGLVVDDPITNVDNIQRHILMGKKNPLSATLFAVDEVLPPVIMSTLAIIVSFAPMFFITGMMGPYMEPMAVNVPLTVTFSTVCALTIVPWVSYNLLKRSGSRGERKTAEANRDVTPDWIKKGYNLAVSPFLDSRRKMIVLLVGVFVLMLLSASLALFRMVPLKILPFDNKNEFQLIVDMPEATTLETTDAVVRRFEAYLLQVPEVTNYVSYTGTSSPIDFNGLVRHYYLRNGSNAADIRINLADKTRRKEQSHEIVLRLRKDMEEIAKRLNADIKIVELPPGPPVISTIVAEIYGAPDKSYQELISASADIRKLMFEEPFLVDIDDTVETPRNKINFVLDKEKAALHGVSTDVVLHTIRLALAGSTPATVHRPGERQPLLIRLILPRVKRSSIADLSQISVKTGTGHMVQLGELGKFVQTREDQTIYHKNLERVVYVFGEMAGRAPAEAILDMQSKQNPLPAGIRVEWAGEGEWKITLRVFRDLGIAFGAALIGIYILLIIQTGSFSIPLVIMMAIPLTIIGIMPGFWILNLITSRPIGGFENPVFFTATSMIGMIALGGIVVRNAVVLIEFIRDALRKGSSLRKAILQSGAIRFRPILLTAATTALGAWPVTLDPIFSGLAWALIFGLFASTMFTLVIVPVVYYLIYKNRHLTA